MTAQKITAAKVIVSCPGRNFVTLRIETDSGVYGIGEMLWTIEVSRGETMMSKAVITVDRILANLRELLRTWKSWTLGSLLGYFVGILPAAGATPVCFLKAREK